MSKELEWRVGMSHLANWYRMEVTEKADELRSFYAKELREHVNIDIAKGADYDVDLYFDESREAANRWLNETIEGSQVTLKTGMASIVLIFTDYADEWRWMGDEDPRCPITERAYYAMRRDVLDFVNFEYIEDILSSEQAARRAEREEEELVNQSNQQGAV